MAKTNKQARHSRDERLRQLAEQDEGLEYDGEEAGEDEGEGAAGAVAADVTAAVAADVTMPSTDVLQTVPKVAIDDGAYGAPPGASRDFGGFDIDAAGYPLGGEAADDGAFVASNFNEVPQKRKRRALKAFGITMGVLIACVLVAYIAGAVVFMGRFLPNTFITDNDISMKTDEEVAELLDGVIDSYQLDVVGNGFTYQTTSADIGLSIDSGGIVRAMHNDLDAWQWPLLLLEPSHDESRHFVITYKRDDCETAVAKKVKKFNKDAKAPVDASIVFNADAGAYEVKPEEEGTQLNPKSVKRSVAEAISNLQPTLTLTTDHLKKPKIYSTDEKLIESAELATGMVSADVTLRLNGQDVNHVSGEDLSQFVSIDDDFDVTFKDDEMRQWVNDMTAGYDTIGTERHYTRADGNQITVKGGSYGWEIDTAATIEAVLEAIKAGGSSEVDIPCISTAATFSASGERDWGNRYVDVDLSEQYVRFYGDNGKIIWESACVSGTPDGEHNTWEGVWYVNNKENPSTLIGYTSDGKKDYEVEVEYWMAFEGNGIGFHDANWQPDFGGTMYQDGYGSHGCINLSTSAAKSLYGIIEIGDVVVVHS